MLLEIRKKIHTTCSFRCVCICIPLCLLSIPLGLFQMKFTIPMNFDKKKSLSIETGMKTEIFLWFFRIFCLCMCNHKLSRKQMVSDISLVWNLIINFHVTMEIPTWMFVIFDWFLIIEKGKAAVEPSKGSSRLSAQRNVHFYNLMNHFSYIFCSRDVLWFDQSSKFLSFIYSALEWAREPNTVIVSLCLNNNNIINAYSNGSLPLRKHFLRSSSIV